MNDKLKRIWKEPVMAYLRYYPDISVDGLKEATKNTRIASVPSKIQSENLPNTNLRTLHLNPLVHIFRIFF